MTGYSDWKSLTLSTAASLGLVDHFSRFPLHAR
jgi:hypothetical protein